MISKFKIQNSKFKIFIAVSIAIFLVIILSPYPFTLSPVYAQSACFTQSSNPRVVNGLISSPAISTKFGNATGNCVVDPTKATFAPYEIPTYQDLKLQYYTKSKAASKQEITSNSITSPADGTVYLYVNPNGVAVGPLNYTGTSVVFVNGNLSINGNITGAAGKGIVFVTGGDINIAQTVTQIDAVLISEGTIYTADAGCTTNEKTANALTINGSVVLLNTNSSSSIKFCRNLSNNNSPAEKIVQQAKYQVILRDLFALTEGFWSEITEEVAVQSPPPTVTAPLPQPTPTPIAPPAPTVSWNTTECYIHTPYSGFSTNIAVFSWQPDPGWPVTTAIITTTDCSVEDCPVYTTTKTLSAFEAASGQTSAPLVNVANDSLRTYTAQLSGDGGNSPTTPLGRPPQCGRPGSVSVCKNVQEASIGSYQNNEMNFSWANNPPYGYAKEILISTVSGSGIAARIPVADGITQISGPGPSAPLIAGTEYRAWACSARDLTGTLVSTYCSNPVTFCLTAPFGSLQQCTVNTLLCQ